MLVSPFKGTVPHQPCSPWQRLRVKLLFAHRFSSRVATETGCGEFLSFSFRNQNYLVNARLKLDLADEYESQVNSTHIFFCLWSFVELETGFAITHGGTGEGYTRAWWQLMCLWLPSWIQFEWVALMGETVICRYPCMHKLFLFHTLGRYLVQSHLSCKLFVSPIQSPLQNLARSWQWYVIQ